MKKYASLFFLVMFLIGTDTFLISPLLPTLARLYQISTSASGWMVSAYALGYALFALISGPFSDLRDRKSVLLGGLISFALATFLCSFAVNFPLMLLFRCLAGISASFVAPQIWAAVPVVARKERVVWLMGIASSGLAIAQVAGVPLGSFLASINWRAPFIVLALASLVALVITTKLLPSLNPVDQVVKAKNFAEIYGSILRNRQAITFLLAYLVFQLGNFAIFVFIGTWFAKDFGLSISGIGAAMIFLGLGQFVGSTFGNRLTDRIGLTRALSMGIISLCLLYGLLAFVHSLVLAVALLMVIFTVNGFIFPVFMTTLLSTTENARSTISSLSSAAMYVGTALAGIIGGMLFMTSLGFSAIAIFTIVCYLITLLIIKFS